MEGLARWATTSIQIEGLAALIGIQYFFKIPLGYDVRFSNIIGKIMIEFVTFFLGKRK